MAKSRNNCTRRGGCGNLITFNRQRLKKGYNPSPSGPCWILGLNFWADACFWDDADIWND